MWSKIVLLSHVRKYILDYLQYGLDRVYNHHPSHNLIYITIVKNSGYTGINLSICNVGFVNLLYLNHFTGQPESSMHFPF